MGWGRLGNRWACWQACPSESSAENPDTQAVSQSETLQGQEDCSARLANDDPSLMLHIEGSWPNPSLRVFTPSRDPRDRSEVGKRTLILDTIARLPLLIFLN